MSTSRRSAAPAAGLEKRSTSLEMLADNRIEHAGLPAGQPQYRFAKPRRWAFDRAWVDLKIALELEGGVYQRGWHQSVERYTTDCEKYSTAAVLGWCVIRCTASQVRDGTMVRLLRQAMGLEEEPPRESGDTRMWSADVYGTGEHDGASS